MSSPRTVVAVVGLVALGTVAGVGAAGPAGRNAGVDTATAAESAAVVQTVVYRLTPGDPGSIEATFSYRADPGVTELVMYDQRWTGVVSSDGFVETDTGRWLWNGTAGDPSLTVRFAVNRTGPTFHGLGWVDAGDWALAHPTTAFAFRVAGERGWVYSWRDGERVTRRVRVDGEGKAGSRIVYLGEFDVRRRNASGHRIALVRPEPASMTAVPDRVLATVAAAADSLAVGGRDDRVNLFVGPSPLRTGGITVAGRRGVQDLWVSERATVSVSSNHWVHEYVHTRQAFRLGPGMKWFREASASYYAGLLTVRQGVGGREGFDALLDRLAVERGESVVLANRTTWENPATPYAKGQRVLAGLDLRIRNATNESRSVQDVFRRMNAMESRVTYGDFRRIVGNVTGNDTVAWVDDHVAGSERVSLPSSPYAYTSPRPGSDADGDGLDDQEEERRGTRPFDSDSDDDGLRDGVEPTWGTDPASNDTDRDGVTDRLELLRGSDPAASNSTARSSPTDRVVDTASPVVALRRALFGR